MSLVLMRASALTALTEFGWAWLFGLSAGSICACTCVAPYSFPKNPHYVLGHNLIYMIILNDQCAMVPRFDTSMTRTLYV